MKISSQSPCIEDITQGLSEQIVISIRCDNICHENQLQYSKSGLQSTCYIKNTGHITADLSLLFLWCHDLSFVLDVMTSRRKDVRILKKLLHFTESSVILLKFYRKYHHYYTSYKRNYGFCLERDALIAGNFPIYFKSKKRVLYTRNFTLWNVSFLYAVLIWFHLLKKISC